MATNVGVQGTIINLSNSGASGLIIKAYDYDSLNDDDYLGTTMTDNDGNFSISYSSKKYSYWSEKPDIYLQIYLMSRLILKTDVVENVEDSILQFGTITIDELVEKGWVPFAETNSVYLRTSFNNEVEILIDNKKAFEKLYDDIAASYIRINAALYGYHTPETFFPKFDPENEYKNSTKKSLAEKIIEVTQATNYIDKARIIMRGDSSDNYELVSSYFNNSPNVQVTRMQINGLDTGMAEMLSPMHNKYIGIDDQISYIFGSPFDNNFYDNFKHKVDNKGRGIMHPRGVLKLEPDSYPMHDVSVRISGTASDIIQNIFWKYCEHNNVSFVPPSPINEAEHKNQNDFVQVVMTVPNNGLPGSPEEGEFGILDSYLMAIRNAEDFIYIENQYFACNEICNALYDVLAAKPNLQVIVLLNFTNDIPANLVLQNLYIDKFDDFKERCKFYTLWTHENDSQYNPPDIIMPTYMHSKLAIIDDKWLTVGTANTDNYSMTQSMEAELYYMAKTKTTGFHGFRNYEMNINIYDGVDNLPSNTLPSKTRRTLWAEHLGYYHFTTGEPDFENSILLSQNKPSGGWIELFESRVNANLDSLKSSTPSISESRILPYVDSRLFVRPKIARYFKKLEINSKKFTIRDHTRSFHMNENEGVWGDWE